MLFNVLQSVIYYKLMKQCEKRNMHNISALYYVLIINKQIIGVEYHLNCSEN